MTNKTLLASSLAILFAFTFSSCKKDSESTVETEDYKGIFVVNEGGFNKSNGSIGLYKPGSKTYFDAFKKANDRPLGDVVQSMSLLNGKFYVVVNNSNKIEVLNQSNFKNSATITTNSPRYLVSIGNNKAMLSNLYSNTVKVVDISADVISKQIDIHHWSDAMAVMNKTTYIATSDNKIMLVNNDTFALIDSISTPAGLSKIVNVGSTKLAVLCAGSIDWNNGSILENGKLLFLSQDSNKVSLTVPLSSAGYGGSMVYDAGSAVLYYSLGNNIINRVTMDGTVSTYITLATGVSVYGMSIDSNNNLYITDAVDYNSAGKVYVYNSSGTKTNEFSAGIVPNAVLINN